MTNTRLYNKALLILLLVALSLSTLLVGFNAYVTYASVIEFDNTDVLDDLQTSTIDGKPFDIRDYPFVDNANATPRIINFVEYCYSYKTNLQENFGLYIYIYNPRGLNIVASSTQNKVQLGVKYNSHDGAPMDYDTFDLRFLSVSTGSNHARKFYKYKIIDKTSADGKTILQRVNSEERRYDVSGFRLLTSGDNNATEYTVGGTYLFTGYAEGYGADENAQSSLNSSVRDLETVSLDVGHTFYRSMTSSKGAGYQNQLDTVYFSVPQRFFDMYGVLQRIKAEWYEYKTKDIVVTSNTLLYSSVYNYLGVKTGEYGKFDLIPYNSAIGYGLGQGVTKLGDMRIADWGWNLGEGYLHTPLSTLFYLFLTNGQINGYDPYADISDIGGVRDTVLYNYIRNYNKTYNNGALPIKDGSISADLFENDIAQYRKLDSEFGKIQQGYSYYDFDADTDLQVLSSWQESNPSFWDNWQNWGFWNAVTGDIPNELGRAVSPIHKVSASDLSGTEAEVAERLLVRSSDVAELKTRFNTSKTSDEVLVLFRFATTDYYSAPLDIVEVGKGTFGSDKTTSGQAYRAWQSVFFDFKIIQLTFTRDGDYYVIPVVSSPIDVVNGITPPLNGVQGCTNGVSTILMFVLLVVLLLVLAPFMPLLATLITHLIHLATFVITLPVKIIKGVKKRG